MLTAIKQHLERENEEGFTLIELMVVVLIIAILLAIAIPTFLGARNSANARAAQSNLRNALTAEQTLWTNNQAFLNNGATVESALTWNLATAAPSVSTGAANQVTAVPGDSGAMVTIEAASKDGNCYYIWQSNDPADSFTAYGYVAQAANACTAPTAPAMPATPPVTITNGSAGAAGPGAAGALPTTWYQSF